MIDERHEAARVQELDEDRGQVRRYLDALRRNRRLALAIVATVTLGALLLSLVLPGSYRATARLVLQADEPAASADTAERQLATAGAFAKSRAVLEGASRRLSDVSPRELDARTSSKVSRDANVIDVTGQGGTAGAAAAIANAVAESFVAERSHSERAELARQRRALEDKIGELSRGTPRRGGAAAGIAPQLRALRARADQLQIQEATAGSDLRLAEPATAPTRPSSPQPVVATVVALFASLLIAMLVVLGREQLSPRASGPRDVGRILGAPVLAGVPEVRRGLGGRGGTLRAAEREAFESLRNAIELVTPPERQKIVVVTSATVGEGKTTVAVRLARSLVTAGQSTLLVSGDLRRPSLHRNFGLPSGPGLSDLLRAAASGQRSVSPGSLARFTRIILPAGGPARGSARLAVLPSGEPPADPAPFLTSDLVASLFEQIGRLDYEWVLVDAPPLLGTVDAQVLGGSADALLLVSRLDLVTVDQLLEERDRLDRLEVAPLGVVVIGSRVETSAYERGRQPRAGAAEPRRAPLSAALD